MVFTQTGNGGDEYKRPHFGVASEGDSETVGDGDASLEETAERERDYLRERLRDEWRREPTEEELDEWLREHTEGH
jgi:ubiquinone biosynthesis protein UbiJ